MFRFEKSILIRKTRHQVFAFLSNPSNDKLWRSDVVETTYRSLPLNVGDHIEETVDFNGLHKCVIEVIEIIPDKSLILKAMSGTTYLPVREFTLTEEGPNTKLTVEISAHSDGFSRLIEPISSNMYSVKWDVYLFDLKKVLEDQP